MDKDELINVNYLLSKLRTQSKKQPYKYLTQDKDGWFKIHQSKPRVQGIDMGIWVSVGSWILIPNRFDIRLSDPMNTIIDLEDYK